MSESRTSVPVRGGDRQLLPDRNLLGSKEGYKIPKRPDTVEELLQKINELAAYQVPIKT